MTTSFFEQHVQRELIGIWRGSWPAAYLGSVPCQAALRQQQPVVPRVFHKRSPVLTRRCCTLVSDQWSIRLGSTSRHQRLPRL